MIRALKETGQHSLVLVPHLQEVFAECYLNAREQAADETGLPLETFPVDCPYSPERSLDSEYLPD